MTTYLPFLCVFLPVLLYGAYLLIQAERRRQERLSQRKAKRAHDEAVRQDNGFYRSFRGNPDYKKPIHFYSGGIPVTISSDKGTPKGDDVIHVTVGKDDTREIPTIEAENADSELSDIWVNAIEGLEIEE